MEMYTAVFLGLSAFLFCMQGSYGDDVVLDSYAITDPASLTDIEYNRVTDTIITFTATVSSAANGGVINGIDVYFVDGSGNEVGGKQAAAGDAPTATDPETITNGGVTSQALTGNTATLKFATEADCTAAAKLCVLIKGGGVSTTAGEAEQCLDIGTTTGQAGATNCAAITFKADTFAVTAPTTYKLNRTAATILTFNAGLINPIASEVGITSYKLHLSDNEDLAAGGAKVSDAIDVITDAPTTLPASADGTADKGLTTGMTASVQILSETDCSAYNRLCLKVDPGAVTDCIDITGKTDCTAAMATTASPMTTKASTTDSGVGRLSVSFGALMIVIVTVLSI